MAPRQDESPAVEWPDLSDDRPKVSIRTRRWAKFNMIAKFILELVQFQSRSRNALDSEPQRTATMEEHIANQENLARRDEQRSSIAYLWRESVIMNHEVI